VPLGSAALSFSLCSSSAESHRAWVLQLIVVHWRMILLDNAMPNNPLAWEVGRNAMLMAASNDLHEIVGDPKDGRLGTILPFTRANNPLTLMRSQPPHHFHRRNHHRASKEIYIHLPIRSATALHHQCLRYRLEQMIPANAEAMLHNSSTTPYLSNIPPASCSIASRPPLCATLLPMPAHRSQTFPHPEQI
jgi:hypothetical protein